MMTMSVLFILPTQHVANYSLCCAFHPHSLLMFSLGGWPSCPLTGFPQSPATTLPLQQPPVCSLYLRVCFPFVFQIPRITEIIGICLSLTYFSQNNNTFQVCPCFTNGKISFFFMTEYHFSREVQGEDGLYPFIYQWAQVTSMSWLL